MSSITYGGEAFDSFRHALDAMRGYTVRLEFEDAREPVDVSVAQTGWRDDQDAGDVLECYHIDATGERTGELQSYTLADVETVHAY